MLYVVGLMGKQDLTQLSTAELFAELQERLESAQEELSLIQTRSEAVSIQKAGQLIRKKRLQHDANQQELADMSEVSYSTISKIEANNPKVLLENILKVAGVLGLEIWIS
ncbi:hypothetical protein DC094_07950 [Pelagibaculum spongiae]|uniref:HTH cro/C1-type domain-containing protein n=2 Tax=Pelagibaculum spongiae TaxID=2080658 RepID=A0A2V1GVT0_9GAMM|nr:hypothetical protein DC094_07950 [Pelagibaculum spongiae]